MSFTVTYTGGFNPFEWEDLRCPVCGASEFASQDHTMVFCDRCYADFEVRMTAGDPGCVVDCLLKEVYAPLWECTDCGKEEAFFDWQDPICPNNSWHSMRKADPDGLIRKLWKRPRGYPKSFYLILKLGDYCSGWLDGYNARRYHDCPTQEQWERFQREANLIAPPFGARWALITHKEVSECDSK